MNSLILKVKFLGVFAGLLVTLMTYLAIDYTMNFSKSREVQKAILLYTELQNSNLEEIKIHLKENFLKQMPAKVVEPIIAKSAPVLKTKIFREALQSGDIQLFSCENYYYYKLYSKGKVFYFKNLIKDDNYLFYLFLASLFLVLILSFIYFYIIKAMKPLKTLYKKMHKLGNKEQTTSTLYDFRNKDEIALVSEEFDKAVERLHILKERQTFFWRNIIHEFKTPMMQGLLIVHLLENSKEEKEKLLEVFDRMKEQLDKVTKLETLASTNSELSFQKVNMLDILDDVKDVLHIEENDKLCYKPISSSYHLDASLFTIGLKNLIDNAIKYSSNQQVTVLHKNQSLYIINLGKPLESSFKTNTQAFVRGNLMKDGGMGLGLYLANEIFLKHKVTMKYKYFKGKHIVILDLHYCLDFV